MIDCILDDVLLSSLFAEVLVAGFPCSSLLSIALLTCASSTRLFILSGADFVLLSSLRLLIALLVALDMMIYALKDHTLCFCRISAFYIVKLSEFT
jgi:hypothetical protein